MSRWKSLKSAPRNGEYILLWNGIVPSVAHWSDELQNWKVVGREGDLVSDASHWMPLPPAPVDPHVQEQFEDWRF